MSAPESQHDEPLESPVPGLEQLAGPRMPTHDLWPGIELRLKPRRRGPRLWPLLALAASLVAVLGAGLVLRQDQAAPVAPSLSRPSSQVAAGPAWRGRADTLTRPEERALVKANLQIVDDAQSQLRYAIASDPQSAYLQRLMLRNETRQRELRALLDERK